MSGGAQPRLVLASASPRRLALLRLAGLDPVVRPADIDETPLASEDPVTYVTRLARAKAAAVAGQGGEIVLAADTTVVLDGEAIGKPVDDADARAILQRLAGRTHQVTTAVAVTGPGAQLRDTVVTTAVVFACLTAGQIAAYVASGEPRDKAGAYAIQGAGAVLVERIEGSWTNVVGLPVVETLRLLKAEGLGP
jgi:septum formation protein